MALNRTAAQAAKSSKIVNTTLSTAATTAGAVTGIFAAAAGLNAVPVAGQIVGAALALAGILTKIFMGKRQKKKREAAEKRQTERDRQSTEFTQQREVGANSGLQAQAEGESLVGKTAPVTQPDAPSYGNWGVDRIAAVQTTSPAQQAVNNSIGINK